MAPSGQHYGNHTRFNPAFHFFAFPLAALYLGYTIRAYVKAPSGAAAFAILGAFAVVAVALAARLMALRVQDRLIRLEEQLRFARLLPADVVAQTAATFSPRHYIALRFASDGELPALVATVLRNPAISQKEIKQAIREWRGDYLRA